MSLSPIGSPVFELLSRKHTYIVHTDRQISSNIKTVGLRNQITFSHTNGKYIYFLLKYFSFVYESPTKLIY